MHAINLNGQWDFVCDLDPKYHLNEYVYPERPYSRPDANRKHWLDATVPGVWQKYGERYDILEGVCWFAREFELSDFQANTFARLKFGAVNYLCDVFINGHHAGRHEGGYTQFYIDVTRYLLNGINHIAVMVDNRATTIKFPHCLGYFNYGGIHRDVTLEIFDKPSISDISIKTGFRHNTGWLDIHGKITPTIENTRLQIICKSSSVTIAANDTGYFSSSLEVAAAESWSPEHPNLETVSIIVETGSHKETYSYVIGFRTIEVQAGKIILNSKPIPLKGVCYIADFKQTGLTMTKGDIVRDIQFMKEAGCNAVRCHYPMDEGFYNECDKAGLMVWIEPPVYCYHPADNAVDTAFKHWVDLATQMASEMVGVAVNHPSVIIYGIGNECNTQNIDARHFFKTLAETIRNTDNSRLISYAALYGNIGSLGDIVDVLGINSYWGWYDKIFGGKGLAPKDDKWQIDSNLPVEPIDLTEMQKMLDGVLSDRRDLVLLLTEFGADSVYGFRSDKRPLWSENYHHDLLKEIFSLAAKYPQIAGTFPFLFNDYRDPSKVPNGWWNELNLKGFVTYDRKKKLAFDALKQQYHSL